MTLAEDICSLPTIDPLGAMRDSDRAVQISFWWFQTKNKPDLVELLYGWVLPSRVVGESDWYKQEPEYREMGGEQCRLVRTGLTLSARNAYETFVRLAHGKSLFQACKDLGLGAPILGGKLSFDETYKVLPPAYFPTIASLDSLQPFAKGRRSLSSNSGCWCTRIATTAKFSRFLSQAADADELLRGVLGALEAATGFQFRANEAEAVGSVEVFAFPSLTEREQSVVEVEWSKAKAAGQLETVSVRLLDDAPPGRYLVHLRASNLADAVFDEIVPIDDEAVTAAFNIAGACDGIIVRIWHKNETAKRWILWHEQELQFFREFNITMRVLGLSGELGADWLARLSKSRSSKSAEDIKRIQQVSFDQPVGTSSRDAWEQATVSARNTARRLFPARSEARFFPQGWEGDSRLKMAHWFREQLSKYNENVVLMDPYFDVSGLEVITRASGVAREIAVLTCCQIASEDDKPELARRADRLVKAAKHLQPILSGIKLRILDLRSTGGGTRPLFHDRYLVFFTPDGHATRGFNLSTSLQGATRTSPLLITLIPEDVLDPVSKYLIDLLNPDPNVAKIIKLFPPERSPLTEEIRKIPEAASRYMLIYAAVLHDRPDYMGDIAISAYERLIELGLAENGRSLIEAEPGQVYKLAAFLDQAPSERVADVWCGLCEADARSHADRIAGISAANKIALRRFLTEYLPAVSEGRLPGGVLKEGEVERNTLAQVFETTFREGLVQAAKIYDYHHEHPIGTTYPKYFACKALVEYCPDVVDNVVARLREIGEDAKEMLTALVSALVVGAQNSSNTAAFSEFAKAKTPFLRAFAAVAIWRYLQAARIDWPAFDEYLSSFDVEEAKHILARAIYDLRVEANRGRGSDESTATSFLPEVFSRLINTFESRVTDGNLLNLIPGLSGPINGSWSKSTHSEFIIPLQERQLIDRNAPFRIWRAVLEEKIRAKHRHFYGPTDSELIDTWAAALWTGDESYRTELLKDFEREIKEALRKLREPFLATRDYERWRRAADDLLWCFLRLFAIEFSRPYDVAPGALSQALREITQWIDEEGLVTSAIGELRDVAQWARNQLDHTNR